MTSIRNEVREMKFETESYEKKRELIFRRQRIRNSRIRRMRRCMATFVMITAFLIIFVSASVHGKAEDKNSQKFKYYKNVTVSYGDTLWSIADDNMDQEYYDHFSYISEVKSINHIKNENDIIAGKNLIVPYYSNEYVAN